jgi:chemotaxis protein methyltransferase CheR
VRDSDCVAFLQWALPKMRLRWPGFRRVRRQVCRRLQRRLARLGLADLAAYRDYLEAHEEEWAALDALCRITISRFYRDRSVFDHLRDVLLPELADRLASRGETVLRFWSAGSASGEEPYSLSLAWTLGVSPSWPGISVEIIATDSDERLLERARDAVYPASSLRAMPDSWREAGFEREGPSYRLREEFKQPVHLQRQDIREGMPDGPFHLIFCRNLVFTYFADDLQGETLRGLVSRLEPGGHLLIGSHESLPAGGEGLVQLDGPNGLWVRR